MRKTRGGTFSAALRAGESWIVIGQLPPRRRRAENESAAASCIAAAAENGFCATFQPS
jgi:hypothetical protein